MNFFSFPTRRPVATLMFFLAVVMLGLVGWFRIPVELLPALSGDELYVSFMRPGSEPEIIEREILMPLEARVSELAGVEESWGEVRGSSGSFRVRFEPGVDLKMRELEMQRMAAELARAQPRGTFINVSAQDLAAISRFVMIVQVVGGEDRNALRALVDERIQPRLAGIAGVSRVLASGGASSEVTVRLDPDRCAELGVTPEQVTMALKRSVGRLSFLGGFDSGNDRTLVMLDGRPRGVISLGEIQITTSRPVLLRHVADISYGVGLEELVFRVNGKPTVGLMVFQEEGANLVRLGRSVRDRLAEVREEFQPYGIDFVIGYDAADVVEEQLARLKALAATGFVIALAVLLLFLRQMRAVAVVAVAVPVSLLAAVAMLYLGGWTINLITLFGLAVGIGMLVDNSIVVYEAVHRQLECGSDPDAATEEGVRRTLRAIIAASATNAIVFLPVAFATDDAMIRSFLITLAIAILLPLCASVLVAIGLVPLLARYLAAPAAVLLIEENRKRRQTLAGLARPDRWRELFSAVLKVALRRPAMYLASVAAAVLITVIVAVPWVAVTSATQEAAEADEVRINVATKAGDSLDATGEAFALLEEAALELDGVDSVESIFQEEGGTLTVKLVDQHKRPADLNAARVRQVVRTASERIKGAEVRSSESAGFGGGGSGDGSGGGGEAALFGNAPAEIVVSGPDSGVLETLAAEIEERLKSHAEIDNAWTSGRAGQPEIRVIPNDAALVSYGLTADQVLPALGVLRREGVVMQTGMTMPDGREVPLTVRRVESHRLRADSAIEELRLATARGVLPLGVLADVRKMPAPPTIMHHNGRREISVYYRLSDAAPKTGPSRAALDDQIIDSIREVHRPVGYIIDAEGDDTSTSWFKRILAPVLLLLLALLAITFESLTMPVLVLVAVPLTVLGATWALVFSGTEAGLMALVGIVALIGVTVNPAILLVDRMQYRAMHGWSAGAAALAAVRERTRAVLMTSCTTIAGLWPLALTSGREMEIWPPFATVMMGGLATSTLLTLLVIPVGFVLLNRLDAIFGRLGPWVVMLWLLLTTLVMAPLIVTGQISTMTWQITTTLLVASVWLAIFVMVLRRRDFREPVAENGPPVLDIRFLRKVYGRPGPVGRAWRVGRRFAKRVLQQGGAPFEPKEARDLVVRFSVILLGIVYLAISLQTMWWRLVFSFVAAVIFARVCIEIRRWRGLTDNHGEALPGGIEHALAGVIPWLVLGALSVHGYLVPKLAHDPISLAPVAIVITAIIVIIIQAGRFTAVRLNDGRLSIRPENGLFQRPRALWRSFARPVFSFDLDPEEIEALANVDLRVERGMVGILGPNGAGKTTLLRLLAGVLEPSLGVISIGGIKLREIRRYLARWVGYLPQDFGLPNDLSAREYLDYFALLYDIGNEDERRERVETLLEEVGLGDRKDERIGSYSGGMRQRVAVARTLLRLPPIIIVDEPTVGLDPRERIRFRNLLSRLAEGRIVLFSTHVVEDVASACERVIVMARGRVVFDGKPGDLAHEAEGRVWEVNLSEYESLDLSNDSLLVDRIPGDEGRSRVRVLAIEKPHDAAVRVAPNLEDGYLQLVGERA